VWEITAWIIYGGGRVYDIQGGTAYVVALSDLGTYPFGCAPTVTDFTGDVNDLQRTQSIAEACPYDGTAAVAALSAETGGLTDWFLGSSGDFARIVANGYAPSVGLVEGKEFWTNQDYPYNGQTNNIRRSYQLDNTTFWSRINGRTNLIPNDNSFTIPSVVTLTNSTESVPGTPITTVEGFRKTSGVNLLLQSQTLNTTWVTTNVSVSADAVNAPDGTLTADYVVGLTADNVRLAQGVSGLLTDGTSYMVSAYVRAGSYSPALTIATSGFTSGISAYYDLITGTYSGVTVRGTETTLVGTPGIQSVGSGWFRIFFIFTTANSSVETRLYSTNGLVNEIPMAGRNLLIRSQEFDNLTAWQSIIGISGGVDPVRTANTVIAPDGSQTADTIVFNRGALNDINYQSSISQFVVTGNGTFTFSLFAKATNPADVGKKIYIRAKSNLIPITLSATWQRFSTTETFSTNTNVLLGNRGGIGIPDQIVSVDLWGAQLEPGSTALAYIPTGTVSTCSWAYWWGTQFEQANILPTPLTTPSTYAVTTTTAGGVTQYIQQVIIAAVPSGGTTYSLSRYFKVGNTYGSTVQTSLEYNSSVSWGGTSWIQPINLNADGTVTLGTSTNCVSTITNVGSGWYRVALTFYQGSSTPSGTNASVLLRVLGTQLPETFFFTAGGLFENAGEISPWVDSGLISTYNSIITPDGTDPFYTNFTSSLGSTGPWFTGGNWNTLALRQSVGSLPLSTNTPFVVLAKKLAGSSLNYVKVELNNSTDPNMWIVVDLRDGTHTVAAQPQTNLILQSQNFSSATWTKVSVNVRSNATLSPGGDLAHYVVKTGSGTNRLRQSINGSPGSQYWVSIWGKAGNSPNVYILVGNTAETVFSTFEVNLNTGTFTGTLGSYVTQRQSVAYQNGWRRIDLRCTIPAGQNTLRVNFSPGESDAAGSFIFLWGCSVTQTTAATPPDYIPTTTTSVTRSGYTHNVVPSSNGYYWIILRRTSTSNATMNCTVTPLSTPEGDSALTGNSADKILIGGCGLSVIPQIPFPLTFDFPATYPAGAWDAIARDDLHLHLMPKDTNLPVRLFREFEI